ncbi:MAG: hypothetical protein AMXMBFR84_01180 [Candidatus Hydrogenedentota bacterium]
MLSWRRDKDKDKDKAPAVPAPPEPPPQAFARPRTGTRPNRGRLGEVLVDEGVISQAQLDDALRRQKETGGFIGKVLVDAGFIDQRTLIAFLVKQCKIPHISLLDYEINSKLFELVPKELCSKHHLLPIDKLGKILTLAMVDPLDVDALEQVRSTCPDLKIKPILCDWSHFESLSKRLLEEGPAQSAQEWSSPAYTLPSKPVAKAVPAPDKSASASPPVPEKKPDAEEGHLDPSVIDQLVKAAQVEATKTDAHAPAEMPPKPVKLPDMAAGTNVDAVARRLEAGIESRIAAAIESALSRQAATAEPNPVPVASDTLELEERISIAVASAMAQHAQVAAVSQEALSRIEKTLQEQAGLHASAIVSTATDESSRENLLLQLEHRLRDHLDQTVSEALERHAHLAAEHQEAQDRFEHQLKSHLETAVTEAVERQVQSTLEREETLLQTAAQRAADAAAAVEKALEEIKALEKPAEPEYDNVMAFPVSQPTPLELHLDGGVPEPVLDTPGMSIAAEGLSVHFPDLPKLKTRLTFKRFLCDSHNHFAWTLAQAVADNPGNAFNPLYLHGGPGLGKSHLLNSVGLRLAGRNDASRIVALTGNRFLQGYRKALQDNSLESFRHLLMQCEMVLFDDLQALANHHEAQEELIDFLNAMESSSRQLVLAGDKRPDHMAGFDPRIISRLSGGVTVRLQAPDLETRMGLLQRQAREEKTLVPEETIALIADRIPSDIRAMMGALRKLTAYAKLMKQELTADTAVEWLRRLGVVDAA